MELITRASTVTVQSSGMHLWVFVLVLLGVLIVGYGLGAGTVAAGFSRKGADGKPWWYDIAFPQPDEATIGALKVLADRYALGEIDAEEYKARADELYALSAKNDPRREHNKKKR